MSLNADSGATRAGPPVEDLLGDHTPTFDERRDRIRWGPVWVGALTTLSTYVVLQLLFFALGWLDLGFDGGGDSTVRAVVSGGLGLVAFFLGGAAAGASSLWHRANDGMANGVVTWAVTVLALLALALIGGGALLGSLADVATQFVDLRNAGSGVDTASAAETARDTAGWAALGLGLSMVASAIGGSIGAKLWPGRGQRDSDRR
ncbi:MAG TPA: hypothetical protein VD903_15690 [Pseudonocardia sp.]|nr:hypothetical protein [Pseudonocardia sp.]